MSSKVFAGRIVGVFGVQGELKCDVTNAARPIFKAGSTFAYETPAHRGTIRLDTVREHRRRLLVRIEGVTDATAAQAFAGATLLVERDAIPIVAGEYLDDDLIDCAVVDAGGRAVGRVERIEHFPASDMLVVGGAMVPMVSAIVREIDPVRRRIVIDPPEGLLRSS